MGAAGEGMLPPGMDLHVFSVRDARYQPWAQWVDGVLVINPVLVEAVGAAMATITPGAVLVTVDGSQHFTLGAVRNPRPFDTILPARPDLPMDPGAEVIPYDLMRQVFVHEQRNVLRLLAAVRAAAPWPRPLHGGPPAGDPLHRGAYAGAVAPHRGPGQPGPGHAAQAMDPLYGCRAAGLRRDGRGLPAAAASDDGRGLVLARVVRS